MIDVWVVIADPRFLRRVITQHLRAQCTTMPVPLYRDDAGAPLALLPSIQPHQLERTLGRLGASGDQEGFLKLRRRHGNQVSQVVGANLGSIGIGM